MKPNIKDISDMNFLGIRTIFHPAMSCRKTPAVYKIMFRRRGGGGGGNCFRDVLVEFLSCHSTWYCNGVRSFINQAHKYPKQSTTYGKENSIALLHFIVINQHMVLQRNAGFKCQVLKTPKVNLTGISLQNVAISISN